MKQVFILNFASAPTKSSFILLLCLLLLLRRYRCYKVKKYIPVTLSHAHNTVAFNTFSLLDYISNEISFDLSINIVHNKSSHGAQISVYLPKTIEYKIKIKAVSTYWRLAIICLYFSINYLELNATTPNVLAPPSKHNSKLEEKINENRNKSALYWNDKSFTDDDVAMVAYYLLQNNKVSY